MKRMRADSADSAVRAMMEAALPPLAPPVHVALRDGDRPFWDGIVRARARDEWSENDLAVAGELARCQADIEAMRKVVEIEDSMGLRGSPIDRDRIAVLDGLVKRSQSLMRSLRMGGKASGRSEDDANRRQIQRQAEKARGELEDEELLAS